MRANGWQLFGLLLLLSGCLDPNAPIKTSSGNLTQAKVDSIIVKCGGPIGMASVQEGQLVIKHSNDLSITGCVLTALQATGQTSLPKIGNQRYDVPDRSDTHEGR